VPYLQAHVKLGSELSLVREAGRALAKDPGVDLAEWMTYRGGWVIDSVCNWVNLWL
jgi:hypothetical protein